MTLLSLLLFHGVVKIVLRFMFFCVIRRNPAHFCIHFECCQWIFEDSSVNLKSNYEAELWSWNWRAQCRCGTSSRELYLTSHTAISGWKWKSSSLNDEFSRQNNRVEFAIPLSSFRYAEIFGYLVLINFMLIQFFCFSRQSFPDLSLSLALICCAPFVNLLNLLFLFDSSTLSSPSRSWIWQQRGKNGINKIKLIASTSDILCSTRSVFFTVISSLFCFSIVSLAREKQLESENPRKPQLSIQQLNSKAESKYLNWSRCGNWKNTVKNYFTVCFGELWFLSNDFASPLTSFCHLRVVTRSILRCWTPLQLAPCRRNRERKATAKVEMETEKKVHSVVLFIPPWWSKFNKTTSTKCDYNCHRISHPPGWERKTLRSRVEKRKSWAESVLQANTNFRQ